MPLKLLHSIDLIPGFTSSKSELLKKSLGIYSIYDLITHYPYRYIDKSKVYSSNEINDQSQYIQLYGTIKNLILVGEGAKARLTGVFQDSHGSIELVWFQGIQWQLKNIDPNSKYIVFGKPQKFGQKYNIVHPEIRKAYESDIEKLSGFQALYSTTETMKKRGLDSNGYSKLVQLVFSQIEKEDLFEFLPQDILHKNNFISYPQALYFIHFPKNNTQIAQSQFRLKFDEFFQIQFNLQKSLSNRIHYQRGFLFPKIDRWFDKFYKEKLPFQLTNAQKRVLKDIRKDTLSHRQMNRLLQGDVGSGKTVVALMTMLMAIDNDFQACMMAPTEILARQHFEGLTEMIGDLPIRIEILTGSTSAKNKKIILDDLLHGKIDILLGTHALIEPTVIFKNLGLVVIDEQHRFGVAQRGALWEKNELPPHVLVMTATPIPRTLAMTLYGDLDYSVIDELPPGRKPIKTVHLFDQKKNQILDFLKTELDKGRQIYIVYPLIEESQKIDLKNLQDGFEELKKTFKAPQYSLTMVHGKMKNDEKNANMKLFVEGKCQILVSTTVIEVGVNVPNASIMMIENADRFGLSQLHQLRGRVGRGAEQSYCFLVTDYKLSLDSRKRMSIMVETNDGFVIAEEDLKLRGPGDIGGTKQSGDIQLKLASITLDAEILTLAQRTARAIVEEDIELKSEKYAPLKLYIQKIKKDLKKWSKIS